MVLVFTALCKADAVEVKLERRHTGQDPKSRTGGWYQMCIKLVKLVCDDGMEECSRPRRCVMRCSLGEVCSFRKSSVRATHLGGSFLSRVS
jgi:hypothetical protein